MQFFAQTARKRRDGEVALLIADRRACMGRPEPGKGGGEPLRRFFIETAVNAGLGWKL
jgi:hypothetical protein